MQPTARKVFTSSSCDWQHCGKESYVKQLVTCLVAGEYVWMMKQVSCWWNCWLVSVPLAEGASGSDLLSHVSLVNLTDMDCLQTSESASSLFSNHPDIQYYGF
jgi:hypothetical protein